jgi:hypothetical protein
MDEQLVRRHKGLGIASFIIALLCVVLILLLFGVAGALTASGKATNEMNMMVGLGLFFAWTVDVIGIGLGIAGALDRGSKKVFPVLGLIFGVAILAISVALVLIGLSAARH